MTQKFLPDWIREAMIRALEPGPLETYARIHMPEIFEEDKES